MTDAKPTEWTLGYQDGFSGSLMRLSGIKGNGDSDNSASFYAYSEGYSAGYADYLSAKQGGACDKALAQVGIDATLSERGSRYGVFADQAQIAQNIKEAMRAGRSWADARNDVAEALDMIANKIARIVNGDPEYADSWHDIAGYAKLVEDRINGKKQ